jgi:hypothetical protein
VPNYPQTLHHAVVEIAQSVVSGKLGPVEASRRFMGLAVELGVIESKDFKFFIDVDSHSDHFPLGAARERWNAEALQREDQARDHYESQIRAEAVAHCLNLINTYTQGRTT